MPIYVTDELMYSCFGTLFDRIQANVPAAADDLLKSNMAIRFRCSDPVAELTFDARERPLQILYGPSAVKPAIDIGLKADTLHCILLGDIGIRKAIGANLLELKGPIWKTTSLASLFHQAQHYYPQVLHEYSLPAHCPSLTR
jgi:hypothetical protein